jgi:hypothetical protein
MLAYNSPSYLEWILLFYNFVVNSSTMIFHGPLHAMQVHYFLRTMPPVFRDWAMDDLHDLPKSFLNVLEHARSTSPRRNCRIIKLVEDLLHREFLLGNAA